MTTDERYVLGAIAAANTRVLRALSMRFLGEIVTEADVDQAIAAALTIRDALAALVTPAERAARIARALESHAAQLPAREGRRRLRAFDRALEKPSRRRRRR